MAGEKPSTTKAVTDTTGAGRSLRREGRDDVLLLDVGRQDGERGRRVRVQRPVPRLAARSVGQALAVPPLGAGAARRAHGAGEARSRRAGHRRDGHRDAVRPPSLASPSTTTTGSEPVPATLVRTALGLRSTWITIGVLRLDRPAAGAIVFGSSARLSGVGRGLATPRLASSPDGAAWTSAWSRSRPTPPARSPFDVKPVRTTRYRLEAEGGASPALLVQVAPRLHARPADRRWSRRVLARNGQAQACRAPWSRWSGGRARRWVTRRRGGRGRRRRVHARARRARSGGQLPGAKYRRRRARRRHFRRSCR